MNRNKGQERTQIYKAQKIYEIPQSQHYSVRKKSPSQNDD